MSFCEAFNDFVPEKRFFPEPSTYRFVVRFDFFLLDFFTGPKSKDPNAEWFEISIVGFIEGEL